MKPFRIEIPEADIIDLRDRLARTRWTDELPEAGRSYGVPLAYVRELAEHWRDGYDWRAHEAALNGFPQFTTEIDGQNVHFVHVRSANPDAIPLLVTHGWPGSVVEFQRVLGPLSEDFHVVAPSIPGFGFSGPTREQGWDLDRVARAWAVLMERLGYDRYGVHGTDSGAVISPEVGRIAPERVVGVHVNGALGFPAEPLAGLTEIEEARVAKYQDMDGSGYAMIQSTRPQTLAYGLHDSPVGQLAWIAEKFVEWTGVEVDRDQLLTNVSVYWFTGTAGSSARLYRESAKAWGSQSTYSAVPHGVAVFPGDLGVRRVAERDHNVVHWAEYDRGGHFPAMEVPELLVSDIREFFLKRL
ncbi:epoxide hydrolase family protein [Streptosporangium carneum]|uniref:Microsomal epoxide hydrolase n=1 Tax=Streptosporangium carneum TaxID=47481 RepID=A0A9W6I4F7_9ACTN|nr:epoxide hydrolase family protein [Streptosporangium carneum]GLK11895.1 microsomal epoxide hydrolase [Streptosporangium carneum]